MATVTEFYTIDAMRMNDAARHMSRNGISLSHRDAEAIGADRLDWLRDQLELIMTSDDRGVHFRPSTATSACFVADAPGTYGSSDGRVWSAHATVEDGRAAIRESAGARVVLRHGSLEPGTMWTSSMERTYPEGQVAMPRTPTSLADYENAFAAALTDQNLDADARAAYLSMLARDVRRIPWRVSGGPELAARIEAAIDRSADPLRGLHTLVVRGRVEPAVRS